MSDIRLHTYFLYPLSAALLVLAVWMLKRYQPSLRIQYYAGFLTGLSGIAAIQATIFFPLSTAAIITLTRFGFLAGVVTFTMLLMFSWYYPIPSASLPKQSFLFWVVPFAFFVPFVLFNPDFVRSVEVASAGTRELYGPSFYVFPAFVAAYVLLALRNLGSKLQFVSGREQRDTRLFIWALIVATLSGFIFDVILPATGRPRVPIGIYSTAVVFGLSAYIVAKK